MDGKVLFLAIISLLLTALELSALRCYRCTANEPDSDCERDVENLPGGIMNCKPYQPYCTLRRVESLRFKGKVMSFYRSCEQRPDFINKIVDDKEQRTYYGACQQDLCNKGDGKTVTITNEVDGTNKPPLPSYEELKNPGGKANRIFHPFNFVLIITAAILPLLMA